MNNNYKRRDFIKVTSCSTAIAGVSCITGTLGMICQQKIGHKIMDNLFLNLLFLEHEVYPSLKNGPLLGVLFLS